MDKIALFPLSLVVFPGEELRLHIFEPRYKQLIHDCTTENITFGIPPYFEGKDLRYGTELEVTEIVKKYDDGKMDIKAKGIGWFEIDEFYKVLFGKLYPKPNPICIGLRLFCQIKSLLCKTKGASPK